MWAAVVELSGAGLVRTGWKLAYVVVVRLLEAVLASFFWSGEPVYGTYARAERIWGTSPLADQGYAGGIMMVEGSLVTIAALAWLFLRLAQEGELRQERSSAASIVARSIVPFVTGAGRSCRRAAEWAGLVPVDHVDLCVSSVQRSLPFYRELLAPLGYNRVAEIEGERGETVWYLVGEHDAVGLRESQTPTASTATASACTTSRSAPSRGLRSTSAPAGSASSTPRSRAGHRSIRIRPATTPSSSPTRRDQARDRPNPEEGMHVDHAAARFHRRAAAAEPVHAADRDGLLPRYAESSSDLALVVAMS